MTLDVIDAAFVAHWRTLPAPPPPSRPAPVDDEGEKVPRERHRSRADGLAPRPTEVRSLPERLLAAAPQDWQALAGHVERARQRGRRVIAVAGCERGEGRTTLLQCLATVLRERGRDVVCVQAAEVAACGGTAGGGAPHDKRIVLVDAGVWFPPGPIRRQRLLVASLGCDAVILVRRVDRPGAGTRAGLLASHGIEVLGEVVTFTPPAAAASASTSTQETVP